MQKGDNNKQSNESAVKVFVRVRPMISIQANTSNIVKIGDDEQSVTIQIDQYNQIQTKFDKIIPEHKNQREAFQNIQPFIDKIIDGFNLTIFAYGQTGSGKTFTMFGKDWENNFEQLEKIKKNKKQNTPLTDVSSDQNFAGLIPRSAHYLFTCLNRFPGEYNLFCSFLQIYNQKIYDLLQDSPIPNALNVHQSKLEGIFVEGLGEFQVHEYTDCLQLMRRGEKNRFIRQTSMNAKSSRSHTIFQILVESTKSNERGLYTKARFNLCDLAGSEKINKKQIMGQQHLQELKNINLSLTKLGNVINSLSKGPSKNLAIFRQSKLTRLLQQSLVGNTNTIIVGAISPSSKNRDQTINTLKFVQRARHIKLTVKPSSISNQSGDLVKKLQQQMEVLRKLLQQKQRVKVPKQLEQKLSKLQQENKHLKNDAQTKQMDIYHLIDQNRKIKQSLVRMERIAADQLSNMSYNDDDEENYDQVYSKIYSNLGSARGTGSLKLKSKISMDSRYSRGNESLRNQFLPPISPIRQKLNKSLNTIPYDQSESSSKKIDVKEKKKIISRLQNIQNLRKIRETQLLKDLGTIQQTQRVKSQHVRGKSLNLSNGPLPGYSTLQQNDFKVKTKKKVDFSDKIKELENRLKKKKY